MFWLLLLHILLCFGLWWYRIFRILCRIRCFRWKHWCSLCIRWRSYFLRWNLEWFGVSCLGIILPCCQGVEFHRLWILYLQFHLEWSRYSRYLYRHSRFRKSIHHRKFRLIIQVEHLILCKLGKCIQQLRHGR